MPPALRTHMKDFWDDASPRRGDFSRRAPLGDSCIPLTNASPKGTRRKTRRPGMGGGRGSDPQGSIFLPICEKENRPDWLAKSKDDRI